MTSRGARDVGARHVIYRTTLIAMLLCASAGAQPAPPASSKPAAASALKRDFARCKANANVDACYDAIRWNPGDPAVLAALGDALVRAGRPGDALRNYRRAAEIAPNTPGVAAKISALEAKQAKRARGSPGSEHNSASTAPRRYSNAAPDSQSH